MLSLLKHVPPSLVGVNPSSIRHIMLSFLDTYSGYNQIPMAKEDKLKITFILEEANPYYKVMTFGLKNAEATY